MTEHSENSNLTFNRFITVGIVIALLLLGIGTIYLAMVLEKRMGSNENSEHKNPLLTERDEPLDDDIPEIPDIPGVVVYHAENDVDQLNVDAEDREKQFRENIEKNKKNPDSSKHGESLKKKDEFAAKRLEYLRKIEEAETREERDRLIEELKKFCEGNTSESDPSTSLRAGSEGEREKSKADIANSFQPIGWLCAL